MARRLRDHRVRPAGRLLDVRRLLVVLIAFGPAGCGGGTPPPEGANRLVNYTCADGAKVTALFGLDPSRMQLRVDGKALDLPLQPSLAGAHYEGEGASFSTDGAEARLQLPGKPETSCRIGV